MTPTEQDKELRELYKQVRNNSRTIYYTDTIGRADEDGHREWAMRDDMWAITTSELDKLAHLSSNNKSKKENN